jgi:hypothetical protein
MRRLLLSTAVFLIALDVAGQEARVTVADFRGMVNRGLKVTTRGPYRHTSKVEGIKTLAVEVDARGSVRVKASDDRAGVSSECVLIGRQVYHRWGIFPWISQTKEEFEKSQITLGAALKEARARKDTEAFEKARGATLNNPAIFQALLKPTTNSVAAANGSDASEQSIAFLGQLPYKGKFASVYRMHWNVTKFASPLPRLVAIRIEIEYAFDSKTGALLGAQTRQDVVYESETKTFFTTDEWEPDPSIVITEPLITPAKD